MRTNLLAFVAATVRRWLPTAPKMPPLLWATGAAIGLAGLNLIFHAEIWSLARIDRRAWLALLGLLLLAGIQAVPVLWQWPPPPLAPSWGQALWRLGVSALSFILGIGLLALAMTVMLLTGAALD